MTLTKKIKDQDTQSEMHGEANQGGGRGLQGGAGSQGEGAGRLLAGSQLRVTPASSHPETQSPVRQGAPTARAGGSG